MKPGSRVRVSVVGVLLGLGAMAVACGSTSPADLFPSGGDAGAGAGDGATSGGDGSANADATTGDGGGGKDGGKRDGGADAAAIDAAPPPPRLGCSPKSGATCDLATQTCCRAAGGYSCQSPQAPCGGFDIPCAQARDCAASGPSGTLCCGSVNDQNRVDGVSCLPTSDCLLDQGLVVVCDPSESDPCPNGGKCTLSSVTFPGFYLCIP